MSDPQTTRYNLVFTGQMLPGTDPVLARRILAKFLGLEDPADVEPCFEGNPIPLRRNLIHGDALRLYRQLRSVGLICDVMKAEKGRRKTTTSKRPRPSAQPGRRRAKRSPKPQRAPSSPPAPNPPSSRARAPEHEPDQPLRADTEQTTRQEPSRPSSAPNVFALRPAFLTGRRATLLARSEVRALTAAAVGVTLCLVVVAVILRFPPPAAGPEPRGPLAAIGNRNGQLIILLADALLLHARSGLPRTRIEAAALGLESLRPPLYENSDGSILVRGQREETTQLFTCQLEERRCEPLFDLGTSDTDIGFAESYLGETRFLLTDGERLLRLNAEGELEAEVQLPDVQPPLLYRDGLLLIPQSDAPLVGVYRPEVNAFGTQIDGLLLTAEQGSTEAPAAILDVAAVSETYYALVTTSPERRALYRFDRTWGAGTQIDLGGPPGPAAYLVPWRDRVLLADPEVIALQRVAPDGTVEAEFTSEMLEEAQEEWQQVDSRRRLLQRVGLIAPLTVAGFAFFLALLYHCSTHALKHLPRVRTGLLDPMPAGIRWRPALREGAASARAIGGLLVTVVVGVGLIVAGRMPPVFTVCVIPALVSAIYARQKLVEGCGGYLGLMRREIVLVDCDGRYFHGRPAALRQGLGFVFSGSVALPLSAGGVRNMRTDDLSGIAGGELSAAAALGQLWNLRHPWAIAAIALPSGVLLSVLAGVAIAP